MTVSELIGQLEKFDPEREVLITDGYNCMFYKGEYSITEFNDNGNNYVDIGIGGCQEGDDV